MLNRTRLTLALQGRGVKQRCSPWAPSAMRMMRRAKNKASEMKICVQSGMRNGYCSDGSALAKTRFERFMITIKNTEKMMIVMAWCQS